MCWVVDAEHSISSVFKYVPTKDEQKYLLNFKVTDQLQHKYPEKEGGIYLVPKSHNTNTSKKYKGALQQHKKEYPILFVDDVNDYSIVTEDCWLIDKEYQNLTKEQFKKDVKEAYQKVAEYEKNKNTEEKEQPTFKNDLIRYFRSDAA